MLKIQRAATWMIPMLLLFAALYIWFTAGSDVRFAFLDRELWYNSRWVHPDAAGPNWQRALYLFVWILPVAIGIYGAICAIRLLLLIRRGILFDKRISRLLKLVGVSTFGSGFADFFGNLITPQIMSLMNPDGPVPFRWYFDSEPAGLMMCGIGFYLTGWIMTEARKLADENEEFI